jgi:hypothetical protein
VYAHESIDNPYLSTLRTAASKMREHQLHLARIGASARSFCETVTFLEALIDDITRTIARNEYGVEITSHSND